MSVIPWVSILEYSRYALRWYVFSPVPGKVVPPFPRYRVPCNMGTWRHMQGFALIDRQESVMERLPLRATWFRILTIITWSTGHWVGKCSQHSHNFLGWLQDLCVSKYQPKDLGKTCLHPVIRLHFRIDSHPVESAEWATIFSDPRGWVLRLRGHLAWIKIFR